jgi:hypothetical protein
VAKRGWRLAVLRGVLPRTSPAHHDFHHFLLSRIRYYECYYHSYLLVF